jgi:threonine/homoserine/homoserine lactone efflux protein
MAFYIFITEAIIISLSGVMAPGPITAVTISKGSKYPWAGVMVAAGHGVVEFPLMMAIFFGVGSTLDSPHVRALIGILGGVFVVWAGFGLLRDMKATRIQSSTDNRSPIFSGILFSIGNPYFLVWWSTVGAALILRSLVFGVFGFVAFALSHWFCDLGWNAFLSYLSFKGGQFFGRKFQQVVFLISGLLMFFVGSRLVADGILALYKVWNPV